MTTTTIASLSPDDPLAASFSENYPSVAAYLENDLSIEALRRGLKARLGWRSGGLRQIVVIRSRRHYGAGHVDLRSARRI